MSIRHTEKNILADYRSDTVTRPTPAMLEAMMQARVGDDVMGEDPEITALEEETAALFGKEAAVFCPSGTMTNQIALMLHTRPGDEVICDSKSHIYLYEGGGMAANAMIQPRLIQGNFGRITAEQIESAINPDDPHKARTSLVSLENTSNRGGGSCYTLESIKEIRSLCQRKTLALHLDGARIFNALVAQKTKAPEMGALFDTLSICLSKSLGAPVGSLLLGSKEQIYEARRLRKRLGGGMRQAGYLAAAGRYALQHHIERLEEDHVKAKQLEILLQGMPWVEAILPVETNIVIFRMNSPEQTDLFCGYLQKNGILVGRIAPEEVRMVVHLDITESGFQSTLQHMNSFNP